jgi:predicted metal-binding membrane protein
MERVAINKAVEWIARRERAVVVAALALTVTLAWAYLLTGAGVDMPDMSAARQAGAGGGRSVVVFAMWAVMMVAMMLPSAAPAILLFASLVRSRAAASTIGSTGTFTAGYLLVWTAFSVVATIAHRTLQQAALLSPEMRATSGVLSGLLLIAAGVYQLTPMKEACLRHCRLPMQFFTRHWRPGATGTLRLGLLHGGYCVGCCWALMGLLVVGGVMNLWWVAAMAVFILVEKVAFAGTPFGRAASGTGLVLAGVLALAITWSR